MKEELIKFETAKLAIERGFDASKLLDIDYDNPLGFGSNYNPKEGQVWYLDIPQSLLQRWLREKYNLQVIIIPFAEESNNEHSNTNYIYFLNNRHFYGFIDKSDGSIVFNSYEEALEQGLQEALNFIQC